MEVVWGNAILTLSTTCRPLHEINIVGLRSSYLRLFSLSSQQLSSRNWFNNVGTCLNQDDQWAFYSSA